MIDLFNPKLNTIELRNLIRLNEFEIDWDINKDYSSEWVLISFESLSDINQVKSWFYSKSINSEIYVMFSDNNWTNHTKIHWSELVDNIDKYLKYNRAFIVPQDRSWIINYEPSVGVIRFGRWIKTN